MGIVGVCLVQALRDPSDASGDYTRYFTDQLITDEDISFDGSPLANLTYEQGREDLSSMEFEHPTEYFEEDYRFQVSLRDADISEEHCTGPISFLLGEGNLPEIVYTGQQEGDEGTNIMEIETPICGIVTGDAVEDALQKLGISEKGSKDISDQILTAKGDFVFDKDSAEIDTPETEGNGSSRIIWQSDSYCLRLDVDEDKITTVDARLLSSDPSRPEDPITLER